MEIPKELLIDPDNLDPYLDKFRNYEEEIKKDLVNHKFWDGKRVFITGITGFIGSHLADKLIELNAEVHGFVRRHGVPVYQNIAHIIKRLKLMEGNLSDFDSLLRVFNSIEPEVVFHLGAQSFLPTSFNSPIETYNTNIIGTANLLSAATKSTANIYAIQVACSSEEYGLVYPNEVPIKETNPIRPQSPYAVSKVATELISKVHYKAYGVPTIITRAFNHTGPRRGLQFVSSVISRQVARNLIRGGKVITIGNPEPIRDFTDVRDMLQGYMLAVERGRKGEPYNLGHGFGISIGSLVKLTSKICNLGDIKIEIDKSRFRSAEVYILVCDYYKAKEELGYRPRIPLTKSMLDNVEYFKVNQHLLDVERH